MQLVKYIFDQFILYLSTLTPNNGFLWKMTKTLINQRDNFFPLERPDKSLAISDLEKSNLFGNHLSLIISPHPDLIFTPGYVNLVKFFLPSYLSLSPAKPISPAEIMSVIHKLRPKKSPERDLIINKIAKNLPRTLILFLYIYIES